MSARQMLRSNSSPTPIITSLVFGVTLACLSYAGTGVASAVADAAVVSAPSTTQNFIAMGQVRMQGLGNGDGAFAEVVEGTSRNAVVSVGTPSAFANPGGAFQASELNLDNGNTRLGGVQDTTVRSGPDCVGQWNINGTANAWAWSWSSANDSLAVTVVRSSGTDAFNCTLTFPNFSDSLLLTHPNWDGVQSLDVATRLTMMNAARLVVVTPAGQTTTIGALKVDDATTTPISTIGPVGAATAAASEDRQIASYDFDAGGDFTISGTIASTTVPSDCRDACAMQVSIGHLSSPPVSEGGSTEVAGDEGAEVTASGEFTDPDGDPLAITKTSGPGDLIDNGDGTWSWSWIAGDDASGSVTVNANDGWGNNALHTFSYQIGNVAPKITSLAATPSPALLGDPVTWSAAASDPAGSNDPLEWSFDGAAFQPQSSVSVAYQTCGAQQMTAVVRDDEGAESQPATASVLVDDAAVGPPLIAGGQNLVQRSQVVPVKLWVGCGGRGHSGLTPAIRLRAWDSAGVPESAPDTDIPVSVSAADTAGVMRQADGMYLYNLQVPNNPAWAAGKELTIEMYPFGTGNPSVVQVVLKLRK